MSDDVFAGCSGSPLHDAPRLAAALGIARVALKRDDLLAFAGGGTKCRKLAGLDRRLGTSADTLLLSGGCTSNQVRIIAALARATGRACEIFLNAPDDAPAADFARLFGAKVHALPDADSWALNAAIRSRLKALMSEGRRAVVVPAAAAADLAVYDAAIGEIAVDFADVETLVVAAGSGATSAGFLLGLDRHLPDTRLIAVSVDRPAAELRTVIERLIVGAGIAADGADLPRIMQRLAIDDRFIGAGYGKPSEASLQATSLAAASEGVLMEPVYTGKALAALTAIAAEGGIARDARVIFWHTGGVPYLAGTLAGMRA
ncbi:MAG TPA: pyridoxal-phosphate dependent enzyme [Rhodanobacteraceae bacterium]|nr:pyridoxal-phosphate dependent enzyme [Rhodanobacteraceae bacterium]